jgi:hypothetical protein
MYSGPELTNSPGDYQEYGVGNGGDDGPPTLHRGLEKTVYCDQGYILVGSPTVRCYDNLTLSAIPKCEMGRFLFLRALTIRMEFAVKIVLSIVRAV